MQSPPSNKKKIILLAVFGLALLLIVILFRHGGPAKSLAFEDLSAIPGNVDKTPLSYVNKTLYLSNGRYFIAYNTSTGASTRLSSTNLLPKITSIIASPSGRYVAFQTAAGAETMEPFKSLLQSKLSEDDQDSQEWWLLNTSTGSVSYITIGSPSFTWLSDTSYAFASGSEILKREVGADKSSSLYKGTGQTGNLGLSGTILYFTDKNKGVSSIDLQTKDIKNLKGPVTTASFNLGRPGCFYYSSEKASEEASHVLSGCSKHDIELPTDIYSTSFSGDGNFFFYYYSPKGGKYSGGYIDLSSGKKGDWSVKDSSISGSDIEIIYAASKDNIILRTGSDYYSNYIKGIKLIGSTASFSSNTLTLDLLGDSSSVTVSKASGFTPQDYSLVDELLKSKGYNPDLLDIRYSIITTDDNRWN